jgi:XTP/dITP diphosphohydrolase
LGDLMFAVVNLTRLAGVHALTALQGANAKFSRRFVALERLAAERGVVLEEVGLEELDRLWEEIKGRE